MTNRWKATGIKYNTNDDVLKGENEEWKVLWIPYLDYDVGENSSFSYVAPGISISL